MKNKLYEKIRTGEKKPCGIYCLCNFGGLAIYDILYGIEDKAVSGFDFGEGAQDIRTTKIFYTISGRSYIVRHNRRYYFDEIERI